MSEYNGASRAAIQSHYDLSNDFYSLWLDDNQIYSCALWADGSTFEQAQIDKLDYLIDGAKAEGANNVLEIGCGWGALLRRLADEHDVKNTVGLTLSQSQHEHIVAQGHPQVEVRLENWIDHAPEQPYDAIISIEAFEHFAQFGMLRSERVEAYRAFFQKCREWLRPGARLVLQTSIKGSNTNMSRQMARDMLFIVDNIFTESELPWLSEIYEASERIFDVVSVVNHADHYVRTCAVWARRLQEHANEAELLVGADTVAAYKRYLNASSEAFFNRHIGLARIFFERI